MNTKSWRLIEAHGLTGNPSDKFPLPSGELFDSLEKGHKVKLLFESETGTPKRINSEQLWVEILLVHGNQYLGQLEDEPQYIEGLHRGEMVEFREGHVIETD